MATAKAVDDPAVKKAPRYHLADWRQRSEYPSISETNPAVWAWEFLRRSHIYANDVKKALAVAKTLRKSDTSYEALPISLPDNFRPNESLAPWACYPSARPTNKSLAEYERDQGQRPTVTVRRDRLIPLKWRITDPLPPREAKSFAAVRFVVPGHRPAQIILSNANQPRHLDLVLLPDEFAVVFDLRQSIEPQFEVIKDSLEVIRQDELVAARHALRRSAKAQPMGHEMWVMLRLADAVREHQRRIGWTRGKVSNEFSGEKFKFKSFLDVIQYEANRNSELDTGHRQFLTNTLKKAHLQNWRTGHLVRLIYRRGYLELLPAV